MNDASSSIENEKKEAFKESIDIRSHSVTSITVFSIFIYKICIYIGDCVSL